MGSEPFPAKDKCGTSATGVTEDEETHHQQYIIHRYVTVPDERHGMCHCDYRKQQPSTVRRRYTIGAYGIINRLLVLYVMIVLGLTMGMQPIVGYNFGAQKHDRVKATLRLTIIAGVCITSTGFLICELFPHAISAIFTSDEELIDIASVRRTHCRSHIPAGRCTDCHRQFLPKHREGENQYLLVADTPITVSVAGTTDIPALLWAGRHHGYVCRYRTSLLL